MSHKIGRSGGPAGTFELTAGVPGAETAKIPYGAVAGGVVFVTSLSGATKLLWYVAADSLATPVPLYSEGSQVETAGLNAGRAFPIPDEALAAPFLVAVPNSGAVTIQIYVKA